MRRRGDGGQPARHPRPRQGARRAGRKLVVFIFESLLNERAATQIRECAPLRGLFAASADKRRTQRAVLKGEPRHAAFSSLTWAAAPAVCPRLTPPLAQPTVSGVTALVTAVEHGAACSKTPAILMALYEIDLLEEEVLKWAQVAGPEGRRGPAGARGGRAVRHVAPEAEEDTGEEGAVPYAS